MRGVYHDRFLRAGGAVAYNLRTMRTTRRALPTWLLCRPIAHRGLHGAEAPENTLPAFEAALRAGYPIELDVHVLKDGEVIVFHDDDLLRAVGDPARVSSLDVRSLRGVKVFGSDCEIPTLRDVLGLVQGRVPLLIEIKARSRASRGEAALLRCLSGYAGPFAVQSFNPWSLAWFRKHAPEVLRGQLAGPLREDGLGHFERFASHRLLTAALSAPDFINFDLAGLPDRWLRGVARALGAGVLCWTVRSESDRRKAEALGLNYVFDAIRP